MKESLAQKKQRAAGIVAALEKLYPNPRTALAYTTPLELLVATILSAQCTDKRVNMVTPSLFARYPDARAFAAADPKELEQSIRSCGFYKNKAKNIIGCCRMLVEQYSGQVPAEMDKLVVLPGVGRKTANVLLGNVFGIEAGIAVDTHVKRISNLLRLSGEDDPDKIEQDLLKLVPQAKWTDFTHIIIEHGRHTCVARRPRCSECCVSLFCPSAG